MPVPSQPSTLRRGACLGAGSLLLTGTAAALLAGLATTAGATGTTFTVDSSGDGLVDATHCTDGVLGNCTLRDALTAAQNGDTVTFASGISIITLTGGQIDMNAASITGPGASSLTIFGDPGATYTFNEGGLGDVVFSGFTLNGGRARTLGTGNITLREVTIVDSAGGAGGAFSAQQTGALEIIDCLFDRNRSYGAGGAIYANNSGTVTITNSQFIGNAAGSRREGGAIFTGGNVSAASITGSTFNSNTAGHGGALYAAESGSLEISDSTFTGNLATYGGGAVFIHLYGGGARITGSTFDSNFVESYGGGALYLSRANEGMIIIDSTFSNNSANEGGALFIAETNPVRIVNSTLTGNVARQNRGGALYAMDRTNVTLAFDTITGNSSGLAGGGVFTQADQLMLSGTIVSANAIVLAPGSLNAPAIVPYPDIDGNPGVSVSSNHSLIGQINPALFFTDVGGTVRSDTPGLLALASNGGPTRTMALAPTSPALDAGPDPVATGTTFDQRGTPYVRVYNGHADIGAYELQPDPTPTTTTAPGPVVPAFTG